MKDKNSTESQTIIGHAVEVEGNFAGQGDVIIEGNLKGTIKTEHSLKVGREANVQANVEAMSAVISGRLTGEIKVKKHLEITKTARIEGNISCETLSIEAGSFFNGQCQMLKTNQSQDSTK